jgi:hypothetical protein
MSQARGAPNLHESILRALPPRPPDSPTRASPIRDPAGRSGQSSSYDARLPPLPEVSAPTPRARQPHDQPLPTAAARPNPSRADSDHFACYSVVTVSIFNGRASPPFPRKSVKSRNPDLQGAVPGHRRRFTYETSSGTTALEGDKTSPEPRAHPPARGARGARMPASARCAHVRSWLQTSHARRQTPASRQAGCPPSTVPSPRSAGERGRVRGASIAVKIVDLTLSLSAKRRGDRGVGSTCSARRP